MTLFERIKSLLTAANATTGKSDTDLTAGVQSLIDGFGGGTPTSGPRLISDTTYTHAEDWLDDSTGNGENIANTYLNALDTADRDLYWIYATGNSAPKFKFNCGLLQRYDSSAGANNATGALYRDDALYGVGKGWGAFIGAYISRGTKIRVLRFSTEEAPK